MDKVHIRCNILRMGKLFCFDIDNTLLPAGLDVLPSKEKYALHRLKEKGNIVAIASGRNYDGVIQYLAKEDIATTYVIAGNAAAIYGENGELLDDHCLDLNALYHFYKKYGQDPNINVYALGRDNSIFLFKEDWHTDFEIKADKIKHVYHLSDKAMIDGSKHKILKILMGKTVKEKCHFDLDETENSAYSGVYSSPRTFEIMKKGVGKAYGVEFIRKRLGIAISDVYCFGDGGNDLEMIANYNGIALGGAAEGCKVAAKFVTKNCEDDGVYFYLHDVIKAID
jgi:Cof subfamily protein (haloacid dehalogenase superfamily)